MKNQETLGNRRFFNKESHLPFLWRLRRRAKIFRNLGIFEKTPIDESLNPPGGTPLCRGELQEILLLLLPLRLLPHLVEISIKCSVYSLLDQDGNCSIEDRCFGYLPVHRIGFVPRRNPLLLPNLLVMCNISQSSVYRYAYYRYVR